MRVLHVTNWPGPPFDGTRINRYHTLKRLASLQQCRFVVVPQAGEQGAMDARSLAELGIANEGVELVSGWDDGGHYVPRLWAMACSELPPSIAVVARRIGGQLRSTVAAVADKWQPDAIMIWFAGWCSILAETATQVRRVVFACDCMSMYFRNVARHHGNPIQQLYHRALARRFARFEQTWLPRYDAVVFVTQRDAAHARLPGSVSVAVIPNAVDADEFCPAAASPTNVPPTIVFHGDLGYLPNRECVRFLGDEVGPRLAQEFGPGGFQIRLLGRHDRGLQLYAARRPWLQLTGYVTNLARELGSATLYAAPLALGAGIKNKILEALACGLPVVGTGEAFAGIDVRSGVHVAQCSLPQLSGEVSALLRDTARRQMLGRAARAWILEHASWDEVARRFDALLAGVPVTGSSSD